MLLPFSMMPIATKANRNFLGILEGFGFSRNPVIRTGPPKFNDAAVWSQVQVQTFKFS